MTETAPERDPLADAEDVTPTDPDETEGKETDIPADDEPVPEHPAEGY